MTDRGPRIDPQRGFTLGLLALDGAMLSGLAGPSDMLRVAQQLAQLRDPGTHLQFRSQLISARGSDSLRCSSGLRIEGMFCSQADPDVLLVPGAMHASADDLVKVFNQEFGDVLIDVEKRGYQHMRVVTPYMAAVVKGSIARASRARRSARLRNKGLGSSRSVS